MIDVLVNRGYLSRSPDPGDRRRVALELTDRGQTAVEAVLRGVEEVDRQLRERISADQIEAMRLALIALTEIKGDDLAAGKGQRRPARRFGSPIEE